MKTAKGFLSNLHTNNSDMQYYINVNLPTVGTS